MLDRKRLFAKAASQVRLQLRFQNFLEVDEAQVAQVLLQQFGGKPPEELATDAEGLSSLMDRFEELPLCFMGFHGGTDVDEVLEAMVSLWWYCTVGTQSDSSYADTTLRSVFTTVQWDNNRNVSDVERLPQWNRCGRGAGGHGES